MSLLLKNKENEQLIYSQFKMSSIDTLSDTKSTVPTKLLMVHFEICPKCINHLYMPLLLKNKENEQLIYSQFKMSSIDTLSDTKSTVPTKLLMVHFEICPKCINHLYMPLLLKNKENEQLIYSQFKMSSIDTMSDTKSTVPT